MDSPSYSRSSHNDRLPAGSPAFVPGNRRLLVSRPGDRGPMDSSDSEDGAAVRSSRCAKCGHLLMGMLFCRNCGQRRTGDGLDAMDFASAFGGIKDALREDERRSPKKTGGSFVLHSVDAVCCVLQDMLQLKYGLLLDDADLLSKMRHHCNGSTPEEVVKLFNSQRDLHVRSSGSHRLVSLRLEWTPLSSFEALQAKVRCIPGTASAVAVVPGLLTDGEPGEAVADCAVAVFREAYSSHPRNLIGRCAGAGTPLLSMSSRHFRWAAALEPQIVSELRGMGPSRKPMECGAPCWRDEYSAVVKNDGAPRGYGGEPPVPKLQLPLHSGRSTGRSSGRRSRHSARLTSQCSTEATSPGRPTSPERPVAGLQLGRGMEAPWNLWDPAPGVFAAPPSLLPYQEPLVTSTWPAVHRTPGGVAGLTPPSGLIAPQLTPRHLFGGTAPVMYT